MYRRGHTRFEDAVGVVDAHFGSEDLVLTVVACLYVAWQELCLGGDLLHASGEGTASEGIDLDLCGLADADVGEVSLGDVDPDPELGGFEHGDDDLSGADEVACAHADCLAERVDGGA